MSTEQPLRVLVVDDEVDLCELACDWLTMLGYAVRGVHSGAEALDALEAQAFDVLFTDVVMAGGMDGLSLVHAALPKHPQLLVLLASGYARGLLDEEEVAWPLLSKPYRKAELSKFMALVTGQAAPAGQDLGPGRRV